MNFKHKSQAVIVLISIIALLNPHLAYAVGSSGFENASYSARSLGQSNAVVARPEEPSTVAFNPAGIAELPGVQIDGNLEGLWTHTFHKNSVTHNGEKSLTKLVLVPTSFITANLGETFDHRVGVGASLTFPFGLSNRYKSHSVARYAGYNNQIKLAALTLGTGIKVTDKVNIGGGLVYYRLIQYDQAFNYPNGFILGAGAGGLPDGKANTYMHGDGWGWTFGTLIKPAEKHRIGAYYRSRATVNAKGRVVISDLILGQAQGYTTSPYFETAAKTDIPLPQNITVGYAYVPSEKWSAEVDLGWTGWSVFADQNFEFNDANALLNTLGTIPRNYHNTLSLNMGGHYRLNKKWDLLWGSYFYSNAAPEDTFDPVIPDSNRFAGTLGFTYKLTDSIDVSATYLLNYFQRRSVNNNLALAKSGVSVDGEYRTFLHGFMTGATWRFGEGAVKPATEQPKIDGMPKLASSAVVTPSSKLV